MNITHTLATLCVATSLVGTASAAVIGIDNRNGFDGDTTLGTGSDFDQFRSVIASMGHTIVLVNDFTNLAGIDSIIAQNPHSGAQSYSLAEMGSISTFVAGGGGMLALGEAGGNSTSFIANMNQMVAGFEAEYSAAVYSGSGLIVNSFASHAVTAGVSQVGVDFYRKVTASGDTADLTGDTSDFIAARDGTGGAGNSVFLGDISLWKDFGTGSDYAITDLDNELLLRNIVGYITVPAPSSLSLLGFGVIAMRRRRG
jgi:hypothetical protein